MVDFFGLSIIFLGGATVYSLWKEYDYRNKGDSLKTEGPVVMKVTPITSNPQNGILTQWSSDPSTPITQPDRVRGGTNPYKKTGIQPTGRLYATPGVDLFPGGRQVVAPVDSRNPTSEDTMVIKNQPSDSVARQQGPGLDHPDSKIPLMYPQPISGYINQWDRGQQLGINMTNMRDNRRNRHWHDRPTTFNPSHITTHTILTEDIAQADIFPRNKWDTGVRFVNKANGTTKKTVHTSHVRHSQSSRAGAAVAKLYAPVNY